MFDWTRREKIHIYFCWFFKGLLEDYEFDLIRYVPIKRTFVDGTLYYLMFTRKEFGFIILKTEITEQGEVLTNVESLEFEKAFVVLFSKLFPKRAEEARMLAYSSPPFYSSEEISVRWSRLIDKIKINYAVTEQVNGDAHYTTIPYLLTKKCIGAFFVGPEVTINESDYIGDKKEQAIVAADVARNETQADFGIGILHYKDRTIVCVMGNKRLEISQFVHKGIIDPEEQIARTTVIYIINIIERLLGIQDLGSRYHLQI